MTGHCDWCGNTGCSDDCANHPQRGVDFADRAAVTLVAKKFGLPYPEFMELVKDALPYPPTSEDMQKQLEKVRASAEDWQQLYVDVAEKLADCEKERDRYIARMKLLEARLDDIRRTALGRQDARLREELHKSKADRFQQAYGGVAGR